MRFGFVDLDRKTCVSRGSTSVCVGGMQLYRDNVVMTSVFTLSQIQTKKKQVALDFGSSRRLGEA